MTTIDRIDDEASYDEALARIDELFDDPAGSPGHTEFLKLLDLAEVYEDRTACFRFGREGGAP